VIRVVELHGVFIMKGCFRINKGNTVFFDVAAEVLGDGAFAS